MSRILFLKRIKPKKCELCGKVAELRSYGPNGENVCFPCGMLDEDSVKKQFQKILDKVDTIVVGVEDN